ncbi:hypothetical protein Gorai_016246, partial [Gossypium raimondii]|nr:hypothetical protein [Gossypium raimondii]
MAVILEWSLRRKQKTGALQKKTYLTLKHQQKKISTLMLHSIVLPKLLSRMSASRTCKFIYLEVYSLCFF